MIERKGDTITFTDGKRDITREVDSLLTLFGRDGKTVGFTLNHIEHVISKFERREVRFSTLMLMAAALSPRPLWNYRFYVDAAKLVAGKRVQIHKLKDIS